MLNILQIESAKEKNEPLDESDHDFSTVSAT